MKVQLLTLSGGNIFRFPEEKTIYKAHGFNISDENGIEVEYTSFLNEDRYIRNGSTAMAEVEIISTNN